MKITITIDVDEAKLANSNRSKNKDSCDKPPSLYARFFNETSPAWNENAEYNLTFLRSQQMYANEMLKVRKYVFLNDVYDMLGLPRTKAGQIVGWIYDEKNPIGDNCIDFGIFVWSNREFVNGHENTVLLDFNVDGNILDRL